MCKQERISSKSKALRQLYHVSTEQEALARFEHDEQMKTKEIDQIETRVPRPHFTDHSPSTLDDGIRYSEVQIQGVSAIAVLFERPPTLEMGLSFDLRQIPRKYYKYLPILARCFDSLGLKEGGRVIPYSDLLTETKRRFVEFGAGTADSSLSHRADLTFKVSVTSVPEFRDALDWVRKALLSSNLDLGNAQRLRDIVAERIAADDSYTRQPEHTWVFTPAQAFRYQSDGLYLALESQFTKAHWDGRLRWLLHDPVSAEAINHLSAFATKTLMAAKGVSRSDLARRLSKTEATGLEAELIDHWKRNLNSFPEDGLPDGLAILAREAQEDLRSGPANTIRELEALQRLVVSRRLLRLDLLVSPQALEALKPDLEKFVDSIPDHPQSGAEDDSTDLTATHPIIDNVVRQNGLTGQQSPWYLGLVIPEELTGNITFYSDFVSYSQNDRASLVRLLSSGILSGLGPDSVFMKSREAGLAYALFMRPDPARQLLLYYADRSLDVPSLISSMNSAADAIPSIKDPHMVDYALRQAFPMFPRPTLPFSMREQMLVQDIRDGNSPEKVRRFYEGLGKLRNEPNLLSEMTRAGKDSLCGVLLEQSCISQQKADHSIFFFVSTEKILADVEKRLPIRLIRIWPSDFWLP